MSDQSPQGPQVDVGVILKKLQDKLSEAILQIAILETQLEMAQSHDHAQVEPQPEPAPNL